MLSELKKIFSGIDLICERCTKIEENIQTLDVTGCEKPEKEVLASGEVICLPDSTICRYLPSCLESHTCCLALI